MRWVAVSALALSFTSSLATYLGLVPNPHRALFFDRWFQFALGVITYLYCRGMLRLAAIRIERRACVVLALCSRAMRIASETTILTAATCLMLASLRYQRSGARCSWVRPCSSSGGFPTAV